MYHAWHLLGRVSKILSFSKVSGVLWKNSWVLGKNGLEFFLKRPNDNPALTATKSSPTPKNFAFLYKGLVIFPGEILSFSGSRDKKFFSPREFFFMREFVFFSQQTNPQYKKITFYTQYRSYFIGSRTKTCFALCPDSFSLRTECGDITLCP